MGDQADGLREMIADRNAALHKKHRSLRKGQKVIAVASGKGGVGKTSIAVSLAVSVSRFKRRVLVLDADLGLSNVNIIVGKMPKYNLLHVFRAERRLEEIICRTDYGIDIIAGANGFSELADLSESERLRFIEQLESLSVYDYIFIDTGAGISSSVTSFLLSADKILIVTTPEPTSVTDAYGIIKVLAAAERGSDIGLVVNRVKNIVEGQKTAKKIIDIAKQFLQVDVSNAGVIYNDEAVNRSLYKRVPFVSFAPKAKCSAAVESIASRLIDLPPSAASGDGAFTRFFKSIIGL